jgi:hypothetical protein
VRCGMYKGSKVLWAPLYRGACSQKHLLRFQFLCLYTLSNVEYVPNSVAHDKRRLLMERRVFAGWRLWFFSFSLKKFSTLNLVSPLWLILCSLPFIRRH